MKLGIHRFSGRSALLAAVALTAAVRADAGAPPSEVVAIVGATVFDGTGAAPHPANVVIRDGRIAEVEEVDLRYTNGFAVKWRLSGNGAAGRAGAKNSGDRA